MDNQRCSERALREVGVTVIKPSGNARMSRPTLLTPLVVAGSSSFAIGWMRNTSTQLTARWSVQLAPGLVIFQTLPWPVVPSLVQRLPLLVEGQSVGSRNP